MPRILGQKVMRGFGTQPSKEVANGIFSQIDTSQGRHKAIPW